MANNMNAITQKQKESNTMTNYISSIMSNYGDVANVKNDVKTLNEILARQGNRLLIDVMAENAGDIAVQFSLSNDERENLTTSLCDSLRESLNERL